MAFLDQTFSVEDLPVSTQTNFEPLPEGWYTSTISGAEIKATKAGNGQYINVKYTIIGPTHQGRIVFGMINIKNPNPQAEEIGRQQLGEIMRAIGLTKVSDTDQLIGGNLSIKLKITPANGNYESSNSVTGFKSAGNGIAIASKPPSTPPVNDGKTPPPWAVK
jgi:Protein of unknown function (DUF669)